MFIGLNLVLKNLICRLNGSDSLKVLVNNKRVRDPKEYLYLDQDIKDLCKLHLCTIDGLNMHHHSNGLYHFEKFRKFYFESVHCDLDLTLKKERALIELGEFKIKCKNNIKKFCGVFSIPNHTVKPVLRLHPLFDEIELNDFATVNKYASFYDQIMTVLDKHSRGISDRKYSDERSYINNQDNGLLGHIKQYKEAEKAYDDLKSHLKYDTIEGAAIELDCSVDTVKELLLSQHLEKDIKPILDSLAETNKNRLEQLSSIYNIETK